MARIRLQRASALAGAAIAIGEGSTLAQPTQRQRTREEPPSIGAQPNEPQKTRMDGAAAKRARRRERNRRQWASNAARKGEKR